MNTEQKKFEFLLKISNILHAYSFIYPLLSIILLIIGFSTNSPLLIIGMLLFSFFSSVLVSGEYISFYYFLTIISILFSIFSLFNVVSLPNENYLAGIAAGIAIIFSSKADSKSVLRKTEIEFLKNKVSKD